MTDADMTRQADKREALYERLPERFRFSHEVYGDVADDATRVLLALTDGGHADQPSDYLRWVSITAAQALATRPAPVVSDLLPAESIALTVALAQVQRGDDPSPNVAGMCVLALARLAGRHDWTVADAPAADEVRCGWCGIKPAHDPADCAVAKAHESQRLADIEQAVADEGRVLEVSPGAFMEVERRPCANCGHSQPMHVCTFTSVRCRCGCVRYVPAPVADEGRA